MRRTLTTMTAARLLGLTVSAAAALTPTETVKTRVDDALLSLSRTSNPTAEASERRRADVRRAADALFDFPDMSRRALGRHWTDRSPAEREDSCGSSPTDRAVVHRQDRPLRGGVHRLRG